MPPRRAGSPGAQRRVSPPANKKAALASGFLFPHQGCGLLHLGYVLGGGALRPLHDVELNPVALGKAAEAFRLDGGVVDETILVPILRGDKAKTLRVVEPLHRADGASH